MLISKIEPLEWIHQMVHKWVFIYKSCIYSPIFITFGIQIYVTVAYTKLVSPFRQTKMAVQIQIFVQPFWMVFQLLDLSWSILCHPSTELRIILVS